MTTRSIRLVAYLVPLLVLGSEASLASSGPPIVGIGSHLPSAFCLSNASNAHRGAIPSFSPYRIAQFGHCSCCGKRRIWAL
jgi:hypothetical protein